MQFQKIEAMLSNKDKRSIKYFLFQSDKTVKKSNDEKIIARFIGFNKFNAKNDVVKQIEMIEIIQKAGWVFLPKNLESIGSERIQILVDQ